MVDLHHIGNFLKNFWERTYKGRLTTDNVQQSCSERYIASSGTAQHMGNISYEYEVEKVTKADGISYRVLFTDQRHDEGVSWIAFLGLYQGPGRWNGKTCVVKQLKQLPFIPGAAWSVEIAVRQTAEKMAKEFYLLARKKLHFLQPQLTRVTRLSLTPNPPWRPILLGEIVAVEDVPEVTNNALSVIDSDEIIAVFCHFSYVHSQGKLLVCNIRGVQDEQGYQLTDAAICSNQQSFGAADNGIMGINAFFKTHRCTGICHYFCTPDLQCQVASQRVPPAPYPPQLVRRPVPQVEGLPMYP